LQIAIPDFLTLNKNDFLESVHQKIGNFAQGQAEHNLPESDVKSRFQAGKAIPILSGLTRGIQMSILRIEI